MRGRLGPYEILAPIGSGGMGEVYRARDTRVDREVAIKVLSAAFLQRPDALARFEREARAIGALQHPHICPLYEFEKHRDEEHGDVDFLVMPYYEDGTLATRLGRGPLPLAEALKYATEIAQAIAAAHACGVTHRDLKPSNIMLTKSSGAVLMDFGLAKLTDVGGSIGDDAGSTTTDLTSDGVIVGTVRYMAPEVLERKPADQRSDLFSFGVIVYEMVTGRRAFPGDSEARVIAAILNDDPPPLTRLCPEAPPALDALVRSCLAKNPAERWQSAADLVLQLESIRKATPSMTAPAVRHVAPRRRGWIAAGSAIALVAVVGSAVALRNSRASVAAAPPHVVALPCTGDDASARAICDGLTESLISKLVRLTQTHPLQVTPQVGDLYGDVRSVGDAQRIGAARTLYGRVEAIPAGHIFHYVVAGAHGDDIVDSQAFSFANADIFEGEERAIAWIVRAMALELTVVERQTLIARPTSDPDARVAYLSGRGYLMNARDEAAIGTAIDTLNRAVEKDPGYTGARAALGMAWRAKFLRTRDAEDGERARAACTDAVRLQPNLSDGHTCIGMLLHAQRKYEDAAAELARAVEADPTNDDAIVWLGRAQEDLHLPSDAERTYQRAIESRPRYFTAYLWLANFYRRQGRYDDAVRSLEHATTLAPGHARLKSFLALPLMYVGRYDDAIAAVKKAIDVQPTREGFTIWGLTLFRMRRFGEAASTLEQARAIGPIDHTLLGSLARVHYWIGTPDARAKAEALYKEAIQLAERDLAQPTGRIPRADAHIAAADYWAKLGSSDEAHGHLRQVGLNVDDPARPSDPHLLFFAALVYAQLDERDTAIKWLERAVYWGVPAAELRAWPELDRLRNNRAFQQLSRTN